MPPPEVHNTTVKVGPSCATVEDMGNDSVDPFGGGDSWKESLRVRRLIRNHFDIHGMIVLQFIFNMILFISSLYIF